MSKQKKEILKFTAIFDPAEEGGFTVTVPALPGCITEGDTFEEAVKMTEEAISLYVDDLRANNEPIPGENKLNLTDTINVPITLYPQNA